MMNKPTNITDIAQTLVKSIGYGQLLNYFEYRLNLEKDLPSRHRIISAYAQLAQIDAVPLLIRIATDKEETNESRVASIASLRRLGLNKTLDAYKMPKVIELLLLLLDDTGYEICNAAATTLALLEVGSAKERLSELLHEGRLDTVSSSVVQKFLSQFEQKPFEFFGPRAKNAITREHEINNISQAFTRTHIVTLVGMAGIGKTTLAAQYANQSEHEIKLWFSLRGSDDPSSLAMDILHQVQQIIGDRSIPIGEIMPFEFTTVIYHIVHLLNNRKTLLVIDNYETLETKETEVFVQNMVSKVPHLNCLIVGRADPQIVNSEVIILGDLTETEARLLVREMFRQNGISLDLNGERRVVAYSQGNPLLISLMCDVIRSNPDEINNISLDSIDKPLSAIIERSLSIITTSERRALEVLCQFDEPAGIDDPEVQSIFENEQIESPKDMLMRLARLSFVKQVGDDLLFVHSVIRDFIRQQTGSRTTLRINSALAKYYLSKHQPAQSAAHLVRANRYEDAIVLIDESLQNIINQGQVTVAQSILENENNVPKQRVTINVRRLIALGALYLFRGELDKSKYHLNKGLSISKQHVPIGDTARIYSSLGNVSVAKELYDEALDYYHQSLELVQEAGDASSITRIYGNIGIVYQEQGRSDEALDYYHRSLEMAQRLKDFVSTARIYSNIGNVHQEQGNFAEALDYYQRALELAQRIDDNSSTVLILGNIGNVFRVQGHYDEALDYYQRSLEMAQHIGDPITSARQLNNMGAVSYLQGKDDKALGYYLESLKIYPLLDDHSGYANALYEVGTIFQMMDRYEDAKRAYEMSLNSFKTEGDIRGEAAVLTQLGSIAQRVGKDEEARVYFQEAISKVEPLQDEESINIRRHLENLIVDPNQPHPISGQSDEEVAKGIDVGVETLRLAIRCFYCGKDTVAMIPVNKSVQQPSEEHNTQIVVNCEHCKRPNVIMLPKIYANRSLIL